MNKVFVRLVNWGCKQLGEIARPRDLSIKRFNTTIKDTKGFIDSILELDFNK